MRSDPPLQVIALRRLLSDFVALPKLEVFSVAARARRRLEEALTGVEGTRTTCHLAAERTHRGHRGVALRADAS